LIVLASFHFDAAVRDWQQAHRWKNIKDLSRNVTRATDWPAHVLVGLLGAAIAYWRKNKKWTRVFLTMVAGCALAGLVAYGLKVTTGRVRPSVKVEHVWAGPDVRQNYQAFPSGHTAATFGFFAVLFFVNWRLALVCLPIPVFIGFTRIFLGAHHFSDVIGGAVVGVLCAAIAARLLLRSRSSG
jgi:membrane-associated phospholipid phosphatase